MRVVAGESAARCIACSSHSHRRSHRSSTHGTPDLIKKCILTGKFDYVNLHYHFFGSYHASGYSDGAGGEGNAANVRLAKEKDMGVFIISPTDKGGALYRPSRTVADCVYPLSPIAFQCLYLWSQGCDTLSIGISKPSDFDEFVQASEMFKDWDGVKDTVSQAASKLRRVYTESVGKDFSEGYFEGVPTMLEEKSQGVAVSHIIWLHGMVKGYGMLKFAQDRYQSLESASKNWKGRKDAKKNIAAFQSFNNGRAYDPGVDYDEVLEDAKYKEEIKRRMVEAHGWLSSNRKWTDDERRRLGCDEAYSLETWESYPGDEPTIRGVILQNLSGGAVGSGGGQTPKSKKESKELRSFFNE